MEKYYVIYNSGGDISIDEYSKSELETLLNERNWGEDLNINKKMKDVNYMEGITIIKGEVVVPKIVQVETKFEL